MVRHIEPPGGEDHVASILDEDSRLRGKDSLAGPLNGFRHAEKLGHDSGLSETASTTSSQQDSMSEGRLGTAGSAHSQPQNGKLDVSFNTDPLFVRAGQSGVTVPRGLSGVESSNEEPILQFTSDSAYSTVTEISRRASAAREMRAALAAQIAAKQILGQKGRNVMDANSEECVRKVRDEVRILFSMPTNCDMNLLDCRQRQHIKAERGAS
jgi:hypothetical protein